MSKKDFCFDRFYISQKIVPLLSGIMLFFLIFGLSTTAHSNNEESVANGKTIVFTTIFPKSLKHFQKFNDIYKEAFSRLGYGFNLISQPGERALVDANAGVVDGEAGRVMTIDRDRYPDLIRVTESILSMQDGAYAVNQSITIQGYESLVNRSYRVGMLKGLKSVEQKLPLYVDKQYILVIGEVKQGF